MPRPMRWLVERVVTSSPLNSMRPGVRAHDAEDRLERRGLAGGVAAEQADELALVHLEVQVLEDVDLPVVGVDALELQQAHLVTAAFVPR